MAQGRKMNLIVREVKRFRWEMAVEDRLGVQQAVKELTAEDVLQLRKALNDAATKGAPWKVVR